MVLGDSPQRLVPIALAAVFVSALPLSYFGAHDRLTWWLETIPALIAFPLLALTRKRWPLSDLLYVLILAHALILLVGGHFTYALVPAGDWVRDWIGGVRNNYDKLGHFAQGFVPAILTRELLVRYSPFRQAPRSAFVPILMAAAPLAFSALYEIIEWRVAIATGEAADAFLGTQGDVWDTQSDMLMALIGALCAMILIPLHDRSLRRLPPPEGA